MNLPAEQDLPLKDIHLPPSISWWPPAYGWWVLGFAILILLASGYFFYRKSRKPTLKKEALGLLESIETLFNQNGDCKACVSELSKFLRRVVISCHSSFDSPHSSGSIESLTGTAWLKLLETPLGSTDFSQGAGKILLTAPYQPEVDKEDVIQLIQLCHKWVKRL